jgi:hypothetical protein
MRGNKRSNRGANDRSRIEVNCIPLVDDNRGMILEKQDLTAHEGCGCRQVHAELRCLKVEKAGCGNARELERQENQSR